MKIIAVIALAIFAVGCSNPVLDSIVEPKVVTAVELAGIETTVFSRNVELQRTVIYDDGSADISTEIFTAADIGINTFNTEVEGIESNEVVVNFDDFNLVGTFISRVFGGVQYFIEFYTDGTSKRGYIDASGVKTYNKENNSDIDRIYKWDTQGDSDGDGNREFAFEVNATNGNVNYTLEGDCLTAWFRTAPIEGFKYYRSH